MRLWEISQGENQVTFNILDVNKNIEKRMKYD